MAKLGDLFTLQMGKTPSRTNSDYWDNGNNPWVSIADLSSYNKYVGETKETISDLAVLESGIKEVPGKTVIMSFKLSIGKVAITKAPVYTNLMAKLKCFPTTSFIFFQARIGTKGRIELLWEQP